MGAPVEDSISKPELVTTTSFTKDTLNEVGRSKIPLRPHESYEGAHRWDPDATWEAEEEAKVVRKTDLRLLSWLCLMFFGLQLDRGNLSNALTDDLLTDLNMTQNDYNNGTTVQLLCFLAAEFPVQLLIKRYGFKQVLPLLMMAWSLVSWTQAFMTGKVGFYITRALIGACEGGFIPGTSMFASPCLSNLPNTDDCDSLVRDLLLHLEGALGPPRGFLVDSECGSYHLLIACGWYTPDEGHRRTIRLVLALLGKLTPLTWSVRR